MGINKNIKKQRERLFEYYKSKGLLKKECKGVSEEKIKEFEEHFNVSLPKDFIDIQIMSLKVRNFSRQLKPRREATEPSRTLRSSDFHNFGKNQHHNYKG